MLMKENQSCYRAYLQNPIQSITAVCFSRCQEKMTTAVYVHAQVCTKR